VNRGDERGVGGINGKVDGYGVGGGESESGFGCCARFRFFLLRSRACSNVHRVTTIAIARGIRILSATKRYSFELMVALCVPDNSSIQSLK